MDPFEVRMQFLTHLRKLNASQQSIQKVVGYALKYFSGCGEDLWDCIVEECQKGSINNRINIFYFLDSLCETCLLAKSHSTALESDSGKNTSFYVDFMARDLRTIVECVVPEGRQGLPNLTSTKQILENWRIKRVIDPQKIDDIMATLNNRTTALDSSSSTHSHSLSRSDVFKRIEEDRERHKRLRERRWVQPIVHNPSYLPPQLASFMPLTDDGDGEEELTIDIEFENEWETTSDWNEDDDEAAREENDLCFAGTTDDAAAPMDVS
ncbi:hypothetical protein HWV62_11542 [Athelia sp. TMB]|nr:hypothetical protein HWV62_36923 [Athelia sp. TMB]KAF7974657.1 hypothetical protein HWV62_11542 [Athelia sp. TMB]